MSDVQVKKIGDIAPYQGANTIPGIKFRPAARALGVTAWGMSVLELAPHCTGYPEHDHAKDGQEEVYAVISGSATLHTDGAERTVDAGTLIRVPATVKRKFVAGPHGVTLLAIGATPGKAYEPRP